MPSRIVRARLDEPSEQGLSALMREGRNESEAVRTALAEATRVVDEALEIVLGI
ncbi:MAG TPA: hypothetical protein VFT50_13330 [Baekduia sp.]|nr:hypothetical protein [Baekduia sp.]